jgi:hypothetical protein
LTLITTVNEYNLKTDIPYANKMIESCSAKYSKNLINLLKSILTASSPLKTVKELKNCISSNKPGLIDTTKLFGVFKGSKKEEGSSTATLPTKQSETEKARGSKSNYLLAMESKATPPLNSKTPKIFSTKSNPADALKHRSVTPTPPRISRTSTLKDSQVISKPELPSGQGQEKDSKKKIVPPSSKKVPIKAPSLYKSEVKKSDKKKPSIDNFASLTSPQLQISQSQIDESSLLEDQYETNSMADTDPLRKDDLHVPNPTLLHHMNATKENFFSESQKNIDIKLSNLNNIPLFDENNNIGFQFVNSSHTNTQNINSYLKIHDKNVQEQLVSTLNFFDDDLSKNPFFEDANTFFNKPAHQADQLTQGAFAKKKEEDSKKVNEIGSREPAMTHPKNVTPPKVDLPRKPTAPQKVIKRVVLKWMVNENKHVKFHEYDDGTTEEVKEESLEPKEGTSSNIKPVSTDGKQSLSKPDDKPSHMLNYNINKNGPQPAFQNQFDPSAILSVNFILVQNNDQPALLLFRSKPVIPNMKFQELTHLVNKGNAAHPSMYHNVEDEMKAIVNPPSKSLNELPSNYNPNPPRLPELQKPASTENVSRNVLPTSLSNNTNKIIRKI